MRPREAAVAPGVGWENPPSHQEMGVLGSVLSCLPELSYAGPQLAQGTWEQVTDASCGGAAGKIRSSRKDVVVGSKPQELALGLAIDKGASHWVNRQQGDHHSSLSLFKNRPRR